MTPNVGKASVAALFFLAALGTQLGAHTAAQDSRAVERGVESYTVSDGGALFGEPVWKVETRLPGTGRTVKAKDDENLWELAKRVGQDVYVILHHNEEYDF
jgi:hypothetical protein